MIGIINNEVIGLIAIHSVLESTPRINIASSFLIAPLLFDKKTRNYLKRKNIKVLSAQELVIARSDYFVGFNDKFTDSLVTTTNAIAMGIELGVFRLDDNYLTKLGSLPFTKGSLGRKIDDIVSASANISVMLSEPPETLYSLLRLKI